MLDEVDNPIWLHFAGLQSDVPFTTKIGTRMYRHHFPSNFFIEPDGTNVEAQYQAEKWRLIGRPFTANMVQLMAPGKSKKWGRKAPMDVRELAKWERSKRDIMHSLIGDKIGDHNIGKQPDNLWLMLFDTGHGNMVEENDWHDNEWGNCICSKCFWKPGKNILGKIWMQWRENILGEPVPVPTWDNYRVAR